MMTEVVEKTCAEAWRTLRAVAPVLPVEGDLRVLLVDAVGAEGRGYFLPDEDERLREVYRQYLSVRVSLWEMIGDLKPLLDRRSKRGGGGSSPMMDAGLELAWPERLRVFGLAFCAAAMLVRSASFEIWRVVVIRYE